VKKLLLLVVAAALAAVPAAIAKSPSGMQAKSPANMQALPLPGPYSCIAMTANMPAVDAKKGVLVGLDRHLKTPTGPLLTDSGLTVKLFRPGKPPLKVGMAHPACWSYVPVAPSMLNYNYHDENPSILCLQEDVGNYPAADLKYSPDSSPDDAKFGACPKIVWRVTGASNGTQVRWATVIYKTVYDPGRYVRENGG
jgi:hypothetical protein